MNSPNNREIKLRPPPLSNTAIIARAEMLAEQYLRLANAPIELIGISFDAVYEQIIYPNYGIVLEDGYDLGVDEHGEKVLGRYDPIDNVAYIDASLHPSQRDPRRTFTCWHEVGGHALLQGDYLRQQLSQVNTPPFVTTSSTSIDFATTNVLERQANLFASHAAAPRCLLYLALDQTLNLTRPIRYLCPARYTFSVHGRTREYAVESFDHLCRIIASFIQGRFGLLSIEALSYRIAQLPIFDMIERRIMLPRIARPAPLPVSFGSPSQSFAVR